MLHRPMSRALFAGVACLSLATMPAPAPADVFYETGYFPTSSILSLSPSYLPTSYVVPTAYSTSYYPTSYLPTSYIPTSYVPTSAVVSNSVVYPTSTTYIRRSLFRPRRFVERTYYSYPLSTTSYLLPTSYAVPTTYLSSSSLLPTTYLSSSYVSPTAYVIDNGVITTSATSSSYPCETTSSPVRASASRPSNSNAGDIGNTVVSTPSNVAPSNERRPQGSVSNEEPPPTPSSVIPSPVVVPPGKPDANTPPAQPLEERKPDDIQIPGPGKSGPTPPQVNEMSLRTTVRRPTYDGRNILRGKVISAESRLPEEGVTVIVSHISKSFNDRPAMTDADGEFKVSLPDGDWTVKVKMPSGSVYSVGRDYVTASSGRVTDSSGRNVAEFLITR